MTAAELQAIRERVDRYYPDSYEDTVEEDMESDLLQLLTEVERLRKEVAALEEVLVDAKAELHNFRDLHRENDL